MRNAGSGVKGVSRIQCQRSATFDDRVRKEDCGNGPACACTSDTVHQFGLSRYPRDAVSSNVTGAGSNFDCSKAGSGHSSNDGREIG